MESLLSPLVPLSYLQALPTVEMNNMDDNNINNIASSFNVNNNNNSPGATGAALMQAAAGSKQASTLHPPAKKRSSFTACAACQSKHCACDEQRPCSRCLRLRIACTEGVPRKGKAKKKPQKDPGDAYIALERELLSGKYPGQSQQQLLSKSIPSSPAYQIPSTPGSSYPPPSPSPAFSVHDVVLSSPPLNFSDDMNVASVLSAEDLETQLFLYESALPLPSPIVIPPPISLSSSSPSSSSSSSSSNPSPSLPSPSPSPSTSTSDFEIGANDPQFTTFMHSSTPVPQNFEKAIRHEHANKMFAVSMLTSSMHPLQFSNNNSNNNNNNANNNANNNTFVNFTSVPSPSSSTSSTTSQSPSHSPTTVLPGSPSLQVPSPNNNSNNNINNSTGASNAHTTNFQTSNFSPHFPIPDQQPTDSTDPTNPTNPTNPPPHQVVQLQQELAGLRQELAAARYRERLAFPLNRRVKPRETAMSLWSLHDGLLVDYSAGFMKLMKYTQDMLQSLSFYEISPPSTRAQRRHLHAFFIREKPEINGVVSYKSLLNAEGRPIEVMCSASVYYFDDQVLLQLLCFNQ